MEGHIDWADGERASERGEGMEERALLDQSERERVT